MPEWVMPLFVIVAAVALIMQLALLAAMFFAFQRLSRRIEAIATDFQVRVNPILARVQILIEDTQPRISSMIADAAEVTNVARNQVQRLDRVLNEALERLRMQLVHVDQILTSTLDTVEDAGSKLRRSVWGPVQSVAAIVRGIQTGIDFYRGRRQPFDGSPTEQQDESLFI